MISGCVVHLLAPALSCASNILSAGIPTVYERRRFMTTEGSLTFFFDEFLSL
jgi:hypothetical protein